MHIMSLNLNTHPESLEQLMSSLRMNQCTVHSFEVVTIANEYDVHLSFDSPRDSSQLANTLARLEHTQRVKVIREGVARVA